MDRQGVVVAIVALKLLRGGLGVTPRQGTRKRTRTDDHSRDCRLCNALLALARSAVRNEQERLANRPTVLDDVGRESAA